MRPGVPAPEPCAPRPDSSAARAGQTGSPLLLGRISGRSWHHPLWQFRPNWSAAKAGDGAPYAEELRDPVMLREGTERAGAAREPGPQANQ
jgi:hypothetical protein